MEKNKRNDIQNKALKKKGFPFGIFLLLFLSEAIASAAFTGGYFYFTGRNRIREIEQYTRNYSITLAEAFAKVAELGYRKKKYSELAELYHEKIRSNTIDEAFFVLNNGKLVAHSNSEIEEELEGNIANDELTYNLDLILRPSREDTEKPQFTDYNVLKQKVPFGRGVRMYLKKYYYHKIDSPGWLVSRAVYIKDKPVGTVNFIISKKRIYDFLNAHIIECRNILILSLAGSFIIAFLLSLFVLHRYRSIQAMTMEGLVKDTKPEKETVRKTSPAMAGPVRAGLQAPVPLPDEELITIEVLNDMHQPEAAGQGSSGFNNRTGKQSPENVSAAQANPGGKEIKDAIPIGKN